MKSAWRQLSNKDVSNFSDFWFFICRIAWQPLSGCRLNVIIENDDDDDNDSDSDNDDCDNDNDNHNDNHNRCLITLSAFKTAV